jgi:uncharacterized phiE125 gp8 family phage protein
MIKLKVVTESTIEPITLHEARLHLRLDTFDSPPAHVDDPLIEVLITVARQAAESYLGQSIIQKTYELALDEFPVNEISLELWPVSSVDSITYEEDGQTQTVDPAEYIFDSFSKPSQVAPKESWPRVKSTINGVKITFTAGYTDNFSPNPYPLPKPIRQAMLLTIGHLYENRESVVAGQMIEMPLGMTALLTPYRISMGM